MTKYRNTLPQLSDRLFLTDGGMETTFIFLDGVELPYFAAFDLMRREDGVAQVRRYYEPYITLAKQRGLGFILETPTWRASRDWAGKLGCSAEELASINRRSVELMMDIRKAHETPSTPLVISGAIGPRGDGYAPDRMMTADEAQAYHAEQIGVFADSGVDLVTAFTLNYTEEAIGLAQAAEAAGVPAAISFTVETDGKLPTGQGLRQAIEAVDAATGSAPVYYMVNCAHPTHFQDALKSGEPWTKRLRGIRANASTRSHAELDQATDLDAGDPAELGRLYAGLRKKFPQLTVLGGCCGTDHRHVAQICLACVAETTAAWPGSGPSEARAGTQFSEVNLAPPRALRAGRGDVLIIASRPVPFP
jgi:homocysteine S-methyltransferase